MSCSEILDILKENKGKWLTIHDIEEKIDSCGRCAITNALKRLTLHSEILRKKGDYTKRCYLYKYKNY